MSGYTKALQRKFNGLAELSGGQLQERRDKLNTCGYVRNKQSTSFRTNVTGRNTIKRGRGSEPRGYSSINQIARG